MRNSAVHPVRSPDTATCQMPFQFSFRSSTPENCASHMAPFGFVPNTKAPRRSSKLWMGSRTLSSLEGSASRRSWLARPPPPPHVGVIAAHRDVERCGVVGHLDYRALRGGGPLDGAH